MQPYLFPYLGYFQLIKCVDVFVEYDDVNFIKSGWINRNRILLNNKPFLLTLYLESKSSYRLVNQTKILQQKENKERLCRIIESAYRKAPKFDNVFPLLEKIILKKENNLSKYIDFSLLEITNYLDIKTPLIKSSEINKNNKLKGESKVIDICKRLGANSYINAIGGIELYKKENFSSKKIELQFIKMEEIKYPQFGNEFVPNLSIIDVLMFNSRKKITSLLNKYRLV